MVDSKPVPDPTALTTLALDKEIEHLRELIYARIDNTLRQFEDKTDEQNKAVDAALAASDKAIVALDASITRRLEADRALTEAKFDGIGKEFVTYRTLLDSQAEKTAAALAASDKAIVKSEVYNEKRFETLAAGINTLTDSAKGFVTRQEFDTLRQTTTEKIDDLKAYQLSSTGKDSANPNIEQRMFNLAEKVDSLRESRSSLAGLASAEPNISAQLAALATEVQSLRTTRSEIQGSKLGSNATIAWIFAGLGAVATILSIVVVLSNILTGSGGS